MDRHLLTGALLLLIIEVTILLADIGVLPINLVQFSDTQTTEHSIGTIVYTNQNVRRRSQDSIMWESSEQNDHLYSFDSILTLSNSSAKLTLEGDVQIQLHENTLVVLEPIEEERDERLKLQFSRGQMRTRNSTRKFRVGTQGWTVEASAGADLNLRAIDDEKVEVEVIGGKVALTNKDQTITPKTIDAGHRLQLNATEIEQVQVISSELTWQFDKDQRVYTHDQQAAVELRWRGSATKIKITRSGQPDHTFDILPDQTSTTLTLGHGSHSLTLLADGQSSQSLGVHIWPAPSITYFSPLPRDRVKTGSSHTFSWSPLKSASSYRLEFSPDPQFASTDLNQSSSSTKTRTPLSLRGPLYWRVQGVDDEGFLIPPRNVRKIYSVPNPLAPPQLIRPDFRQPASPPKQPRKNSWLQQLFEFALPTVHAESPSAPPQRAVVFSWFPVEGADQYTIEISSQADFQNPEVIQVVKTPSYEWSSYKATTYYWRVAAGRSDGAMGLFSEAAQVDLSKIPQLKGDQVSPGVKLKVTKKKSKPKPKPQSKPQAAPPKKVVAPTPKKGPQFEFEPEVWWATGYQLVQMKGTGNVNASITGLSVLNLGASLLTRWKQQHEAYIQMQYMPYSWEPRNLLELPHQDKLTDWHFSGSIFYGRPQQSSTYGLSVARMGTIKRKQAEAIQLNSNWLVGPAWRVLAYWWASLPSEHIVSLQYGNGLLALNSENKIKSFVYKKWGFDIYAGGQVNGTYYTGSNQRQGFYLWPHITLSAKW